MSDAKPIAILPNGCTLYCKPNEAGGHTYFSDEIGGGVMVWDTCLVSQGTLLAAMACEAQRAHIHMHRQKLIDKLSYKNSRIACGKELIDVEEELKKFDKRMADAYDKRVAELYHYEAD